MQIIPVGMERAAEERERERRQLEMVAAEASRVSGTHITADDVVKITESMAGIGSGGVTGLYVMPLGANPDDPDTQPEPPTGYTKAPRLKTYRFIPRDGSPNRLLEKWTPEQALEVVTREHRLIADWIRAQRGRPGWDLDRPTAEMWSYIHASKRMKACREQLRELVEELRRDNSAGVEQSGNLGSDWAMAQAEADALRLAMEG